MTDLDKIARELLAAEYGKAGSRRFAEDLRSGCDIGDSDTAYAVQAIRAALLTAPPGYVLVPVELAVRLQASIGAFVSDEGWGVADMDAADDLSAMIAAAPEVK